MIDTTNQPTQVPTVDLPIDWNPLDYAEISGVALTRLFSQRGPAAPTDEEYEATVKFMVKNKGLTITAGRIEAITGYKATVYPSGKEQIDENKALDIEVDVAVAYELSKPITLVESDRQLLGDIARFHSWPYMREAVQNMAVRMGFPPLVAPFLRYKAPQQKRD